jgi:hypothetical protein
MSDEGAWEEQDAEGIEVSFRPRGRYTGYKAFGSGEGAVLVEPGVSHELRRAAEFATQERRVTGGLLFGRGWSDEQGTYLVISGFLEAGPGENRGDRISADGFDQFTLSPPDLRLLREDAARMYSASYELGWWRTLPALGEFGPGDFDTQAELVGPDGVGLLVYGSGVHWGTAYLGPDGHAPDSAGTLVAAPATGAGGWPAQPAQAQPGQPQAAQAAQAPPADPVADVAEVPDPGPHVIDLAAGESLLDDEPPATETLLAEPGLADPVLADPVAADPVLADPVLADPVLADPVLAGPVPAGPGQTRRRGAGAPGPGRQRMNAAAGRVTSRVRVPPRARSRVDAAYPGPPPAVPVDVQLVVIALAIAFVAAAIIIGVLVHSVAVGVIIAVIGLLAIASTVWMSRR